MCTEEFIRMMFTVDLYMETVDWIHVLWAFVFNFVFLN